MQRALMQYRSPANYALVKEALVKAGRTDLIGFTPQCLIRPYPPKTDRPAREKKTPRRRRALRGHRRRPNGAEKENRRLCRKNRARG